MPVFVLRRPVQFGADEIRITCKMRHLPLFRGRYSLWLAMRASKAARAGKRLEAVSGVAARGQLRGLRAAADQGAQRRHGALARPRGCRLGGGLEPLRGDEA